MTCMTNMLTRIPIGVISLTTPIKGLTVDRHAGLYVFQRHRKITRRQLERTGFRAKVCIVVSVYCQRI